MRCPPGLIADAKSGKLEFPAFTLAPKIEKPEISVTQVFTSLETSTTEGPTTAIPASAQTLDLGSALAVTFGLILLFCFLYFLLYKYNQKWAENVKHFLLFALLVLLVLWWFKPIKLAWDKCHERSAEHDIENAATSARNALNLYERVIAHVRTIWRNFETRQAERRRNREEARSTRLAAEKLERDRRIAEKIRADKAKWEAKEREHKMKAQEEEFRRQQAEEDKRRQKRPIVVTSDVHAINSCPSTANSATVPQPGPQIGPQPAPQPFSNVFSFQNWRNRSFTNWLRSDFGEASLNDLTMSSFDPAAAASTPLRRQSLTPQGSPVFLQNLTPREQGSSSDPVYENIETVQMQAQRLRSEKETDTGDSTFNDAETVPSDDSTLDQTIVVNPNDFANENASEEAEVAAGASDSETASNDTSILRRSNREKKPTKKFP